LKLREVMIIGLFIFTMFMILLPYGLAITPQNIYTFDTNFTSSLIIVDDYGNSNLSVKVGGIGQYVRSSSDSKNNLSLESYWDGYFNTLDANGTISLDNDYTISLWFKYNGNTYAGNQYVLFRMFDGVNTLHIHKRNDNTLEINQDTFSVGGTIISNTWYNLIIRRNATSSEAYLNGTLIKSGFTTPTGNTQLHLLDGNGIVREFSGWMDEFYVFDDYLNSTTIQLLNNGTYIDELLIPPMNMTNCTEVWYAYYDPSVCMNGSQLKYYVDLNDCGTFNNLPIDNGTTISCTIDTYCADHICLDPVIANETCCVVTPQISCDTYDYLLYNENGSIIETGNLTSFNQALGSYFYYFNRDVGTYYTKICDDSTRQINVVEEDKMFSVFDWTLIILFVFLIISMILGVLVYPLFFAMSALITAFMTTTLWFAGYPPILMGAGILMVLVFTVIAFKLTLR